MDPRHINQVRSFNRAVTRRIGVLDDSFLGRGRPLGQSRLLYEIGRGGAEVRDLRAKLGLDSGYVSRLLRALERQGLVTARPAGRDGRVRRAALTVKGRRELAALDRLAEAYARSVLAPLGASQRDSLATAMATVERLMQAAAVEIAAAPPASAEARWCLDQYFAELARRFEAGFDPARSISAEAAELTPPAGVMVVARLDGRPLGCGALKAKDRKVKDRVVGEVKRMWVASEARGLGLGRRILEALEEEAEALGVTVLRLETNETLTEAQALYRACGYEEVAPFNDEPYAHHWFEKTRR